jgi:hypothetical protein
VYARRQQLGEESIAFAHRVKIEALARLGDLLKEAADRGERVTRQTARASSSERELDALTLPTLADYGISKKVSASAQQLASLPADLREEIASREKSLTQVRREVKAQSIAERGPAEWPEGKYRVIYADPPWSYGNTMPDGTTAPDLSKSRGNAQYFAMLSGVVCRPLEVLR